MKTNTKHKCEIICRQDTKGYTLTEMLFVCDPEKNINCDKASCKQSGGECYLTKHRQFAKEFKLDE